MKSVAVSRLWFHRKNAPNSRNASNNNPDAAVQIAFPEGKCMIGLPLSRVDRGRDDVNNHRYRYTAVAANPHYYSLDNIRRLRMSVPFVIATVINIILSSLIYSNVDIADATKVEDSNNSLPDSFQIIPSTRRSEEIGFFAMTIIYLFIGLISVIAQSPLGLWAFQIAVVISAIAGVSAYPSFVYSLRLILDAFLFHMAHIIRKQVSINVLPLSNDHF